MTRRILAVAQVFPPRHGGSGRWLWELYRRMPAGAVHVAAGEHPAAAAFDSSHGLPTTRLPLDLPGWGVAAPRSAWAFARTLWQIARLHRVVSPDVVHCAKALPEGLLAWALQRGTGRPYWCFAHGEELTLARTSRELALWTSVVLRGAERLVANSHNTARLLEADWKVPVGRITVLHPGVDTNRFVPGPRDPLARAALGWGDRPVLLTVGSLQKRKGQDTVIRALAAIRARHPDVLYVMAGNGPDRAYLEALVREHDAGGHVQFCVPQDDEELVRLYRQCDLFVLANRQVGWDFEGFGIVLLEAQACGKPVVAGTSGGTPEAVGAPQAGRLVDCTSPEPLAHAVGDLLASPDLARMGEQARAWASPRFDWDRLAGDAAVLFGLAASAQPRPARP
jgi:phosphatidyl-myo-inositol dimannoside synthase